MSGYALTPLAKADIFDIWSYIARENEDAANRVEQAIYDACGFLADGPLRGHSRPDLTTRLLRFWTLTRYPNYTVVYRPETAPLQIIAVLHGKRNIERMPIAHSTEEIELPKADFGPSVLPKRSLVLLSVRNIPFLEVSRTAV
jgi:plasmid stabilization system protein ParE